MKTQKTMVDIMTKIVYPISLAVLLPATIAYTFKDPKIQEGYVNPNKLEIITKDTNHDNQNETIIKYDNKFYHLKLDSIGNPYILK